MRIALLLGTLLFTASAFAETDKADRGHDAAQQEILDRLESLATEIQGLQEQWGKEGTPAPDSGDLQALLKRIEGLESEVGEMRRQLAASREELELAWESLDAETEAQQRRTHVTVYGTLRAENFEGEDSLLDGEGFELVLSGRPHPRLGYFAEIEFERAASVGGERGGEVLVEQAYASFSILPWLNLRAGVMLVPFGNYIIDHYAPIRDVISKTLVSDVIAPSDWTDNGLGFEGSLALGGVWALGYETYLVAGLADDITSIGTRAARQGFGEDNNNNKAVAGRFSLNRGGNLEIGLSGYNGKYDDDSKYALAGWAVDSTFISGPWMLTGELDLFRADRPTGSDALLRGYYGRIGRDIATSWLRRGRHGKSFPEARLSAIVQYDEVRIEDPWTDPTGVNKEARTTFGLNYRPTHQWVLKVNHESSRGEGETLRRGTAKGWLMSIGFVF